jgi:GNAT superfamily N-acetyltransferase
MDASAQRFALRDMTLDDVADGLRLSAAAGWNQRDADWRFLLERNPGRFVVAVEDGRIVGSGGAVVYGAELAWVCMILVDPAARGRGIGTRVVEGVLARLTDVAAVGLDATPAGRGLYVRLGFEDTYRLVRMEAPALPAPMATAMPSTSTPAVEAIDARMVDDVLALDREVFGADRGGLLRWAAAQAPALCVREDARIAGYCFGRRGAFSRQVGPVVARDLPTARALVLAARAADPGSVVIDAVDRPDWRAALEADGFRPQRPLVRMYRRARPPGRPDRQFAVFGPEFG